MRKVFSGECREAGKVYVIQPNGLTRSFNSPAVMYRARFGGSYYGSCNGCIAVSDGMIAVGAQYESSVGQSYDMGKALEITLH